MKYKILAALAVLIIPASAFIRQDTLNEIIQPGAVLEKIADGFSFTEGPSSDIHGNVFFTDQPNNRILEWSTDGKLTTFMQIAGFNAL